MSTATNACVLVAVSLDRQTIELSVSNWRISLSSDSAREVGAAMIKAADLLDQATPERPQ